jgi:hypothetical protein
LVSLIKRSQTSVHSAALLQWCYKTCIHDAWHTPVSIISEHNLCQSLWAFCQDSRAAMIRRFLTE